MKARRHILVIAGLAVGVSGCMQSTNDFVAPATAVVTPPPAASATQAAAPAPGTVPAAAAKSTSTARAPATAQPAAPRAASAKPASAPPQPVATAPTATAVLPTSAPLAPPRAAPAVATAPQPLPVTAPAAAIRPAALTASGFPNLNAPPVQPNGKLLPAAERQRIINELEAMRSRQGLPPPNPGTATGLGQQAASHGAAAIKKIEDCAQPGRADDPDCAVPATQ